MDTNPSKSVAQPAKPKRRSRRINGQKCQPPRGEALVRLDPGPRGGWHFCPLGLRRPVHKPAVAAPPPPPPWPFDPFEGLV
jgi:hypothetical protein